MDPGSGDIPMSKKYLFVGVVCIAIALLCIAALATAHEFSVYAIGVSEGALLDYKQAGLDDEDTMIAIGLGWQS